MSAPLVVLPKLPGLVYDTPQAAKKTQSLKFVNGYAVVSQDASVSSAAGGVGIGLRDGLVGSGLPASLLSPPAPAPLPASEPSCSQPRWLVHDKKVLRFQAYIEEAVSQGVNHLAQGETLRLRRLDLLYFLVDDSVEVLEPRVENSGIAQGAFLRRVATPLRVSDLRVGASVPLFGRALHLVACDEWTRGYYAEVGQPQGPNRAVPGGDVAEARVPGAARKQSEAVTRGMQFLAHDGKVLAFSGRFTALANAADEGHPLGTNTLAVTEAARARTVQVFFYLADNTVEIKEPGIGLIMRRQRVPKQAQPMGVSALGGPDPNAAYLTAGDMRVGSALRVFSREYTLCDADPFTRAYYTQELATSQPPALPAPAGQPEKPKPELPPHNGYGSAVDSARNVNTLIPHVSSADARQQSAAFMALSGLALRFTATMVDGDGKLLHESDRGRAFVVALHLEDDTLALYEPQTRERPASRYLERTSVPKPGGQGKLGAADCYVGASIAVFGRTFVLTGADAWSENYMAAHPKVWGSGLEF